MNTEPLPLLYIIDTHVLIWYFTGNKRLSEEMKHTIDLRS